MFWILKLQKNQDPEEFKLFNTSAEMESYISGLVLEANKNREQFNAYFVPVDWDYGIQFGLQGVGAEVCPPEKLKEQIEIAEKNMQQAVIAIQQRLKESKSIEERRSGER